MTTLNPQMYVPQDAIIVAVGGVSPTEQCLDDETQQISDDERDFQALVKDALRVHVSYKPEHSIRIFYYACLQDPRFRGLVNVRTQDELLPFALKGRPSLTCLENAMFALYCPA